MSSSIHQRCDAIFTSTIQNSSFVSSRDVQTIQKNIFSMSELVNKEDSIGMTPLFWACQNLKPTSVQLLLDKGAILNRACKNGVTPLMNARRHGRNDIVKILLARES
jgi:ankyrin repeat protein